MDLSDAEWRKSTRSNGEGNCIEVARVGEKFAARDSWDRSGPVLFFSREAWCGFIAAVRTGTLA